MGEIAILIPTLGRSHKLESIRDNINSTCKQNIYIICSPTDTQTVSEATRLGLNIILNHAGTYVAGINQGYKSTTEPYLLFGADDIEFTPNWDKKLLKYFDNLAIGIVGSLDDWTVSQTGLHGSHPLVKRAYVQEFSGTFDEPNTPYSTKYIHYMADIETEQVAMMRNAWVQAKTEIKHHHWVNKQAEMDETYKRGLVNLERDKKTYDQRRKNFEQYYYDALFNGQIVKVQPARLTVVMGSYNAPEATRATIDSLYDNTYYPFELIVVDDCSNDLRTREYLKELSKSNAQKYLLNEHTYTNGVWNFGVGLAKNEYVVVINNDITFSKYWDLFLVDALQDKDVYIASPYQTDAGMAEPYGKHVRAGGCALRGACFAFRHENIPDLFPIPKKLVHWFGDFYLCLEAERFGKKCVFTKDAVIHHLGEVSTRAAEKTFTPSVVSWIKRSDSFEYEKISGQDMTYWRDVIDLGLFK